jgi:hypothetical protein
MGFTGTAAERNRRLMIDRRTFLKFLAGLSLQAAGSGVAHAFTGMKAFENPGFDRFVFTQLRYRGGGWDPDPTAASRLADDLVRRTSVMAAPVRKDVTLLSPDLFQYPMLYVTGHYDFEPFSDEEIRRLRDYLDYGGFLVADDCVGHPGYDFDKAIRRELSRVYPEKPLGKLSREHPVFKSFYLVRSLGGRRLVSPYLEGIDVGNRTAVLYCQNDFGCALERDEQGNWVHPCLPGGERQRVQAYHLAVNIVLYSLCQDYKSDKIHIPFLRQRI